MYAMFTDTAAIFTHPLTQEVCLGCASLNKNLYFEVVNINLCLIVHASEVLRALFLGYKKVLYISINFLSFLNLSYANYPWR